MPCLVLIMVTPVQSKMARAALGLSPRDIAGKTNISFSTILRFESGKGVKAQTVDALSQWYRSQGIVFSGKSTVSTDQSELTSHEELELVAERLNGLDEQVSNLNETLTRLEALNKPKKPKK